MSPSADVPRNRRRQTPPAREKRAARQTVTIRLAAAGDVDALASLATQLGYASSADQVAARLSSIQGQESHAVLVAEAAGVVIGWVHVLGADRLVVDPYAEIGGLVVDSSQRGHGIGAVLLQAAERWASEHGFAIVRVRSNVVRAEAHRFYESQGYVRRKRQAVFDKPLPAAPRDVERMEELRSKPPRAPRNQPQLG